MRSCHCKCSHNIFADRKDATASLDAPVVKADSHEAGDRIGIPRTTNCLIFMKGIFITVSLSLEDVLFRQRRKTSTQ